MLKFMHKFIIKNKILFLEIKGKKIKEATKTLNVEKTISQYPIRQNDTIF